MCGNCIEFIHDGYLQTAECQARGRFSAYKDKPLQLVRYLVSSDTLLSEFSQRRATYNTARSAPDVLGYATWGKASAEVLLEKSEALEESAGAFELWPRPI